nr:radical SAM protein [Candidatus Sigynarchaeota archaeon]
MDSKFKWLDFKVTNRCNNKCTYCGVKQDAPCTPEKVTGDSIKETIRDAVAAGFSHFAFLGGEPSIRVDLPECLETLATAKSVESAMVITNMLEFNESLYRAIFASAARHAQVVASIDHLSAPNYKHQDPVLTQQRIGAIASIANEYKYLGKREVHVHSVISRENLGGIIDHVSHFSGRQIDVSLALVEPFAIRSNARAFNEFSPAEIDGIVAQLDELERRGMLNWANKVLRRYIVEYRSIGASLRSECTAGHDHVVIESDGNVYPCLTESYRKGLRYGNIASERFGDIYRRMQGFRCESPFQQTCWDHYLWTKLDRLVGGHDDV